MCQVNVNIPEAVLYDVGMTLTEANAFAKKAVALAYYKKQKISVGYCAQIAEMSEEDFIKYLGENQICVFHFDSFEEFSDEVKNA